MFESFNIDYSKSNFKEQIITQDKKEFFEKFIYTFKLMVQMRNSETGTDNDYMISPVRNSSGEFYDSRLSDKSLPSNADANGAYNIAKKGLWVIEKIKDTLDDDLNKVNLAISNKDWLTFAQKKK